MSILDDLYQAIVSGYPRYTEELIQKAIEQRIPPSRIMNETMLPAMRSVGEYYREHTNDIPKILAAARCMRLGLDRLEPYFTPSDLPSRGKVILGTVEGDLHDIGKNLVGIMFRSAGFQVIDLGVDVQPKKYVEALRENPDTQIVCLSSLLSTSLEDMRQAVRVLRESKGVPRVWIMVGGGSVTEAFAREIGADAYTENAVDAAEIARAYVDRRRARL